MTSNEVIQFIRNRLNKLNTTESYQNYNLWQEFTIARSTVLKNQLNRRRQISPLSYHKFCMELIDASEHECPCIARGCTVKKSKNQIPSFITSSNSSTLDVLQLNNEEVDLEFQKHIEDNIEYKPGYKNIAVAAIENGYLYVYNKPLEYIQLKAVWNSPLDILKVQSCNTNICLQDNKDLIQISEDMLDNIFKVMINNMNLKLQLPADNTGDNNEQV